MGEEATVFLCFLGVIFGTGILAMILIFLLPSSEDTAQKVLKDLHDRIEKDS